MKIPSFKRSRTDTKPDPPSLLAVTPPRTGERTLLGVENMLRSLAVPEPLSLEVAADARGAMLITRCVNKETVRSQIAAHYPQAVIDEMSPEDDPLLTRDAETAWTMSLKSAGPEHAPLRMFRDDDLVDPGSDPFVAVLGAVSGLRDKDRVVTQLLLRPLEPDWSRRHIAKIEQASTAALSGPDQNRIQSPGAGSIPLAVLGGAALIALRGYAWIKAGETWKAVLLGIASAATLAAAGWAWQRWGPKSAEGLDPAGVREKLSHSAFEAEVRVTAFTPFRAPRDMRRRAAGLIESVATAYRRFDNPVGARLESDDIRQGVPGPENLAPAPAGFFGRRSVLGIREVAALWHPPGAGHETPLLNRSGSKALNPAAREAAGGAPVGVTTAGRNALVAFPDDLLTRHHLYVARTRMGKSTLMRHVVAHKMSEKAAGRDDDAIVVVDPHADLVDGLLEVVPPKLAPKVRLIDLADERGSPGINLIDTRVFADRDRTADSVVRISKGLWDQWGPRMQSILEHVVKTMHEANMHPDTDEHDQLTLLDGLRLLSVDAFRTSVLAKVSDPFILEWWARDFGSWHRVYRAEALAPVQTRLSYYASSIKARAVLGQSRCTVDLREILRSGGVIFVSTAQGAVGRDVSALVGASLLNLFDAVLREQGALPPNQRRGALVVVDEMQTIPGVDFEAMLSELGKFGASFVLATQSLARLEDLSPTMRDSLMANVGCLCVFQVSGSDARSLVWELGRDRVTEEDIVSQPVHCCYVRANVGAERMPTFSMKVQAPRDGDRATAAGIRQAASAYITPAAEIEAGHTEARQKVAAYHAGLSEIAEEEKPQTQTAGKPGRSRRRGRRFRGKGEPTR